MIHLNIGSNLNSKHGSRFNNINIAINLLIESKIKINKISNFYETPSYPNQSFPNFLNVGLIINYENDYFLGEYPMLYFCQHQTEVHNYMQTHYS